MELTEVDLNLNDAENSKTRNKSTRLKNSYAKVKSATAELILSSTIQGVPNIFRTKRVFLRILWTSLVIIATGLSINYSIKCIVDFLSYDFDSKIQTIIEDRVEFPTVSICKYNDEEFNFTVLDFKFNQNQKSFPQKHYEIFNDSNYGTCYRFNSGKDLLKQTSNIWMSEQGGMYYGLLLNLYVDTQSDYNEFKVHIHNHTKTPVSLFNKGYLLSAGCYNYFQVERVYEKRLGLPYYSCYHVKDLESFPENKTIIHFINQRPDQSYTQDECFRLCQNLIYNETKANQCKCSLTSLDEVLSSRCFRDPKISNETKNCASKFISDFKVSSSCTKYCPLECDSEKYYITYYSRELSRFGNISNTSKVPFEYVQFKTYENVSKRFFSIYVYYENLQYTLIEQVISNELFNLISEVGGIFGLFLGMGLMSFVEIFEVLFEALYALF